MSQPSFKADQVRQLVLDALANGQFQPGQKLPAEAALARQWGMNHRTVRKGLESLVAEGLIVKQPRVGNFIRAESSARFAEGVGLVLPGYLFEIQSHSMPMMLLQGMSHHLPSDRFNLQLLPYGRCRLWEDAGRLAVDRGLQAVVVYSEVQASVEDIDRMRAAGLKVVLQEPPPFLVDHGLPWVELDQVGPMIQILDRLWALGHRRIAFYDYALSGHRVLREAALQQWLAARGRAASQVALNFTSNDDVADLHWPVVQALCNQLMQPDAPTAVIVPDENFAHRLIGQCYQLGLRIPQDFSLALTQDFARGLNPIALTSPDSSMLADRMARTAGKLLRDWLEGRPPEPHGIRVPASVDWTASIGPVSSQAISRSRSRSRPARQPSSSRA